MGKDKAPVGRTFYIIFSILQTPYITMLTPVSRSSWVFFCLFLALSGQKSSAQHSCADTPTNNAVQFDCFSILVGRDASTDGAVLMAHNEDDGGTQVVNYYKVPGKKHAPGDSITLANGGRLEQAAVTFGYLWLNLPHMKVSDGYINEHSVSIASDGCPSREDDPVLHDGGILYWLRRLVAERARSAREGVKIAGTLIERFGYADSGRSYMIADPKEAWMLSVVYGNHWVAQRVPDNAVAVIPNHYTIGEVDLADTMNYYGSSDLIEYAVKRGWYDPAQDGPFHFADAYAKTRNHPGNTHRMWRGMTILSGKEFQVDGDLPFCIVPNEKISVRDLMTVLRDHYEGTQFDRSEHYTLGNPHRLNQATICSGSTQYSFIAHLKEGLPKVAGALVWISPYRPCQQAYIPWFSGILKTPQAYRYADHDMALSVQYDPPASWFTGKITNAYWTFKQLVDFVDEDYADRIGPVREGWDPAEDRMFKEAAEMKKGLMNMGATEDNEVIKLISEFDSAAALQMLEKARGMHIVH